MIRVWESESEWRCSGRCRDFAGVERCLERLSEDSNNGNEKVKRIHYLAAEVFFYSYDNYDDHLGINERFDRSMPDHARLLESGLDGKIDAGDLAAKMEISEDDVIEFLQRAKNARKIIDAESPAEGFREAVKQTIQTALEGGVKDEADIESLVGQICYRAADLGFLLKKSGERLEQYSEELRSDS